MERNSIRCTQCGKMTAWYVDVDREDYSGAFCYFCYDELCDEARNTKMDADGLTWKAGLPIRVGYYWLRNTNYMSMTEPYIVKVRDFGDGLYIDNSPLRGWKSMETAEWAGPIQLPRSNE